MQAFLNLFQKGLAYTITYPSETSLLIFTIVFIVATIVIPYLLGSVNSAIIVSKIFFHEDVREKGSGNAGTTNVMRSYGKKAALLTLLGDILKTVLAIFVGGLFMGLYYGPYGFSIGYGGYIAGFFCIVGHIFPVFYKFRGGKGVLCLATAAAMLSPFVLLLLLLFFIIIVAFTRYVSLGSVIGSLFYPLLLNRFAIFFGASLDGIHTLIAMAAALLIVFCHRKNLRRIMNGEENKFSFHSSH